MKPTAHRGARRRGGFALIITIVLVAFLVLILVGLATFTRVETQVADNSQQIAKARQNALMALNIAIGQLQKTTGPDQRVTATADIAAAATGGRLASGAAAQNTASVNGTGNGLAAVSGSSIQSGTRYWTGVWGRAGTTYATPAKSVYEETPSPVLLNWLVSGNEDRTFTVGADGLVIASTADGRSAGATAPFTPGATIDWDIANLNGDPASWSVANYTDLTIKGEKAVLLVGPKTAGTEVNSAGEAAHDRYVVVPVEDIDVPASSVPGFSGSGDITIGRYGWWVGDEGVKAHYGISDPRAGKNNPADADADGAAARLRLMSSSRSGIELINGFSAYPAANDTAAGMKLDGILQLSQAPFLDAALATPAGRQILASHYHDFSIQTAGLLTDTLNGGLRKDLTHYFEQPSLSADLAGKGIIPAAYSPNWAASGSPSYVPKWDLLYSFYNTNPSGDPDDGRLAVRPATDAQVGISPVITQFRFGIFTDLAGVPNSNVKNIPDGTYSWPIRANVVFVLANPYNVTLTADAGEMEFVIKNTSVKANSNDSEGRTNKFLVLAYNITNQNDKYGQFNILRQQDSTEAEGFLDTVRFVVPALVIPPGETITLSVDGQQTLTGTNLAAEEPVNAVDLVVNTSSKPVRPLPGNYVGSDAFFTSRQPFVFTTTAITGPLSPSTAPGRSIVANYAFGNPNLMITLRKVSDRAIYQQIRDVTHTKTGDLGGYQNGVLGNVMFKFMGPGFRNITGNTPVRSDGGGDKYLFYLTAQGRVFQDYNIRATIVDHPNVSGAPAGVSGAVFTPPPYASGLYNPPNSASATIASYFSSNLIPAGWVEDSGSDSRDGVNVRASLASRGILYDFPRRAGGQLPVLSLGQLQHASLTANDYQPDAANASDDSRTARGSIGYQSGYAVGNSYAAPMVHRSEAVSSRGNLYYKAKAGSTRYFDLAYLLNTSLWDGYFFSGIPPSGSVTPGNSRYEIVRNPDPALVRNADSAAHLVVKGAFNINSTSKDAWVAFLGGLNGLRVNDDSEDEGIPYPRTLWQPDHSAMDAGTNLYQTEGTGDAAYAGYRRLTAGEIDKLAGEIVKRVRARGPFVSLSHFVNRSLVAASGDFNSEINDANVTDNLAASTVPMGRGLAGPLQAAIDSLAAGINTFIQIGSGDFVTADGGNAYGDRVLFNGSVTPTNTYIPRSDSNGGEYFADMKVDWPHTNWRFDQPDKPGPNGRTSTGTPGWLLQGDLLQALGPVITARSDTFVIRTYGQVVNPANPAEAQAEAWCEAVVQRMPDYVDEVGNVPADKGGALTALNKQFGRGYKVISFRWLSPDDI